MDINGSSSTVSAITEKIKNKEISAKQVTDFFVRKINKVEPKIHAFVNLLFEEAYRQAELVDEKISKGVPVGRLAGVPVAIKDNICIKNTRTTCSSKILENFISPYDATVVEKLRQEDAVFIGKTNLDEFAMGSSTENSAFGPTKNPWNLECIPGGSSGGSAAAVSSGMAPLAIGSDTGGSIRQPASCCGVVGFKPTYGRVSRYGLIAFGSSLDQIGPFSRTVEDCSLLSKIISGHDPRDSTSADIPVSDYLSKLSGDIKGLRIGLPKEYFISGLDSEVEKAVKEAVKILEKLGGVIEDISLPYTEHALSVYYIIAPSEASANLARYDGVKYGFKSEGTELLDMYKKTRGEGFGPEVKRRIILGTYALSAGYYEAYYGKAQKVRTLIKQDFEKAFQKVDCLITPTTPTPAFKIGEKIENPLQMYLSDTFTIPCNLAGLPGISLTCGFSKNGLPVGLQILSKPFDEETILRVAYQYQKSTDWHTQVPKNGDASHF